MNKASSSLLRTYGLRNTQARRDVIDVLLKARKPLSHKVIHQRSNVDLVTVYRALDAFEAVGIVHNDLRSGGFILCSLPDEDGHHILLSCEDCGRVEEQADSHLCKHEDRIAKKAGFTPTLHLSEVVGLCSHCH